MKTSVLLSLFTVLISSTILNVLVQGSTSTFNVVLLWASCIICIASLASIVLGIIVLLTTSPADRRKAQVQKIVNKF